MLSVVASALGLRCIVPTYSISVVLPEARKVRTPCREPARSARSTMLESAHTEVYPYRHQTPSAAVSVHLRAGCLVRSNFT